MNKGELVGRGRTADVYVWDQGRILKLYHDRFPQRLIEQDIRISEAVCRAGLPVPRMDGTVEVEGRKGIIFERIEGQTLLRQMTTKPWRVKEYSHLLARLHAEIHRFSAPGLPLWKEAHHRRIGRSEGLTEHVRAAAIEALEHLPDGTAVCHGDFHPDNILITPERAFVIDWMTATQGHPLADVARTSLLLSLDISPAGQKFSSILRAFKSQVHRVYLHDYFEIMPGSKADLAPWMLPLAAVRLEEAVPGEREQVLLMLQRLSENNA